MDEQELLRQFEALPPDVAQAMLQEAERALHQAEEAQQPQEEQGSPAPSEPVVEEVPALSLPELTNEGYDNSSPSLTQRIQALGYKSEMLDDDLYVLYVDKHYHIMPAQDAEQMDDEMLLRWIERALGLIDWAAARDD